MEKEFVAPDRGTWELETTHFGGPVIRYIRDIFPAGIIRGFQEGTQRYGLLLSHPQPAVINDFIYMKQVMVGAPEEGGLPPKLLFQLISRLHPEFRRRAKACKKAFKERLWLQDLALWDEVKADSIQRNQALQSVDRSSLSTEELIQHLDACRDNMGEMYYRHHQFSIGSILPVGRFLVAATDHGDVSFEEAVLLLKGSTPVSTGTATEEFDLLMAALKGDSINADEFNGMAPQAILDSLQGKGGEITKRLNDYLNIVNYMVISGYEPTSQTIIERPELVTQKIIKALSTTGTNESTEAELEQKRRSILERIPKEHHAEFNQSLDDARKINRMRDERGVYNDLWAAGIVRHALLEAGRRLAENGTLTARDLILEATHDEIIGLLKGESSVNSSELQERHDKRVSTRIEDAPPMLGPDPGDPPPVEWLPRSLRPGLKAIMAAMGNVFDEGGDGEEGSASLNGKGVSPGIYEGPARIIRGPEDFDKLQAGDVLITKNTSAAFNIVLPTINALVTDRGGILSHAAIVSREFGIPGVVSTKTATTDLKDGDRIRVDGEAGTVEKLS